MIYICDRTKRLIERYYRPCGLEEALYEELNHLPAHLRLVIGKEEEFWQKALSNPQSTVCKANVVQGTIIWAIELSKHLSEKTGKNICKYLEDSIYRKWIRNRIANYILKMLDLSKI